MGIRQAGMAVALAVLTAFGPAAAQQGPVEHIRGTVSAADAGAITVAKMGGGSVTVALPDNVRVSGLAKASLASVGKGTYLGTTAVPGDGGMLVAKELHLFPEPMRGVAEGHRPWDLAPGSTMTNANVDLVVEQVEGRVLTLSYKGGTQKVLVPADAPVVSIVGAERDELKPGAKVFVVAGKGADGKLSAVRISVGKDGLMPPM